MRKIGVWYNGMPVYKVGVTSSGLGAARVKEQDRMRHVIIIPPTKVVGKASDIEGFALSLGENPQLTGFDGCTDADVETIEGMVELCRSE